MVLCGLVLIFWCLVWFGFGLKFGCVVWFGFELKYCTGGARMLFLIGDSSPIVNIYSRQLMYRSLLLILPFSVPFQNSLRAPPVQYPSESHMKQCRSHILFVNHGEAASCPQAVSVAYGGMTQLEVASSTAAMAHSAGSRDEVANRSRHFGHKRKRGEVASETVARSHLERTF